MFCNNFGKEIDNRAAICPHCGVPVQNKGEKPRNKAGQGLCIAGFVVSLLSLWLGMYFCIVSVVAVVLSAVGMSIAKKTAIRADSALQDLSSASFRCRSGD